MFMYSIHSKNEKMMEVDTMSKAVRCPVCFGKGKFQTGDNYASIEKTCHGCNGRGWVIVPD